MTEVAEGSSMPELQGFRVGDTQLFFEPTPHKYFRIDKQGNRIDVPGVTTVLGIIDKSQPLMRWAVRLAIETIREGLVSDTGALKQLATEELFVLLEDARNKHKDRLDAAGDIGHLTHTALEKTILYAIKFTNGIVTERVSPPTHPLALSCYNAALDWMVAHNVRWLHAELKLYSHRYDVCGTTDGVGLVDSCDDPQCCRGWKFRDRKAIVDWKSSNDFSVSMAGQSSLYKQAYTEATGEHVPDRWVNKLGKEDGEFKSWYQPEEQYEGHLRLFTSALDLYKLVDATKKQMSANKAEIRALVKAEKEAFKAEEKRREQEQRQAYRDAVKAARSEAKAMYKALRAEKMSVPDAEAKRDEWLETRLKAIDVEHGKVEAEPEPAPTAQPDYNPYAEFTVQ